MIVDYDGNVLAGHNNNDPNAADRVIKSGTYRDLSTIWFTPTRDHHLDDQVVFQSWMGIQLPPNQKFGRVCIGGCEVAEAYNAVVELMLRDPVKWKYLLTVEVDNLPPKDGLLKLYETAQDSDVVGGLYWFKGSGGTTMTLGNPADKDDPDSFIPQPPVGDIQPCNGMGMGFTLFKLDMFRHIERPWFETSPDHTQDCYFFEKAKKAGYKFAVDNRVKVGHIDFETRKIW